MPIRLSFCIPTYNFATFLPQTLDSIIAQATDEVEIVIVDGGSTDDTDAIIADYRSRFPRLTYWRRDERAGVDIDILKSVELARGDACWLIGADDTLRPGAVASILDALDAPWDLTLVDFTVCDVDLKPWFSHRHLKGIDATTVFDFGVPEDCRRYCESAESAAAFFSFISAVIVRREAWLAADPCDRYVGSCWIIAAKVYAMMRRGLRLRYDPRSFVNNRRFNDSFLERGMVWRARLSIDGFRAVAEDYFGRDSIETEAVGRVLRREYSVAVMANMRRLLKKAGDRGGLAEFDPLVQRNWPTGSLRDRVARAVIRWSPTWALGVGRAMVVAGQRAARILRPRSSE